MLWMILTTAPRLWELTGADPRAVAVRDHARAVSWAELDRRADAAGHGLLAAGARPGDHVVVSGSSCVAWLEALLGAMRAGMVVSPVKSGWSSPQVGAVLDDAATRVLVTDSAGATAAATERGLPVVDLGDGWERWLAGQPTDPHPYGSFGYRLSFTSGTTGRPKGIMRAGEGTRPWSEAFQASTWMASAVSIPVEGEHLVVSPLAHGAPLSFALSALARGTPLRLLRRWEPAAALRALADGVGSTCVVPTMLRQLLALPDSLRRLLPTDALRTVVHGGEPCPPAVKRAALDWLGPLLVEYYGFSEGGMTVATSEDWLARPGTVGRPALPTVDIVVVDDIGQTVPPGTDGTVCARPTSGEPGFRYVGGSDESVAASATVAAYVDASGGFTAGDRGWLDTEGYLYLSGRTADVIINAGVNVYPAVVEATLYEVPGVLEAAAVGVPDEERGEVPVAVVVPDADADADSLRAQIDQAALQRLSAPERPRRILFRAELPRDSTGKLLRRVLRDELADPAGQAKDTPMGATA
jgi:long-chain acyl-CoA synthetase